MLKRVRLALAVLALLLCAYKVESLHADEISSLMALRTALPRFYPPKSFNPLAVSETGWFNWTQPLDWPETSEGWNSICADGDGPNAFGLTCKDYHIHAMSCDYFPVRGDISDPWTYTGAPLKLHWLKEFNTRPFDKHPLSYAPYLQTATRACYDFLSHLLTLDVKLERIRFGKDDPLFIPDESLLVNLASHTSLKELHFDTYWNDSQWMDISRLNALERLHYPRSGGPFFPSFEALASHLPKPSNTTILDVTAPFPISGPINGSALPSNVMSLSLHYWSPLPISFSSPFPHQLHALTFLGEGTTTNLINLSGAGKVNSVRIDKLKGAITGLPSNLTSFVCSDCSTTFVPTNCSFSASPLLKTLYITSGNLQHLDWLENCTNLENVTILQNRTSLPRLPTSLLQSVNLTALKIAGPTQLNAAEMTNWLSSKVSRNLRHLDLSFSSFDPDFLPSTFTQLESLRLDVCTFPPTTASVYINISTLREVHLSSVEIGWNLSTFHWGTHLPLLENLLIQHTQLTGTLNWNSLPSGLRSVVILNTQLSGTIPHDFLSLHPKMEVLGLVSNRFSGTIPWYGWGEHLKTIFVPGNKFSHFPSIYGGAPQITFIGVSGNPLVTFPDDESFHSMPNLRTFWASDLPLLSGPLPTFWSNHPSITSVDFLNVAFGGTLPREIRSPWLRRIRIAGPGTVCGELPTFPSPTTLIEFTIRNHRVFGSIPSHWSQNLTVGLKVPLLAQTFPGYLNFSNNLLNGTLPQYFFGPQSVVESIMLSNNTFLSGPSPILGTYTGATAMLRMDNTSIDVCNSSTPTAPSSTYLSCTFPYPSSTCTCLERWNWTYCSETNPTCPAAPPTAHPVPADWHCEALPPRPPAVGPPAVGPPSPPLINHDIIISSPITIEGDLIVTPNASLIFTGLYTLNVTGCLSASHLDVELDDATLEKIGKKGITQFTAVSLGNGICEGATSSPTIGIRRKTSGCKEIKAESHVQHSQLVVLFKVDGSRCRIWWIIVVAVGGAIFVVAIAIVLFLALKPKPTGWKLSEAGKSKTGSKPKTTPIEPQAAVDNPLYESGFQNNPM